jgi:hypothetical protein
MYKLRIRSEPALAARPSSNKDKYKYPLSSSVSLGIKPWVTTVLSADASYFETKLPTERDENLLFRYFPQIIQS